MGRRPLSYRAGERILGWGLKLEGGVQGADGFEEAGGGDDAGDADLAGGDQLDVDPRVVEGAEHARDVAGGAQDAGADDADLADVLFGDDTRGAHLREHGA